MTFDELINKITLTDVLKGLDTIPDKSIHCCVTSPPYWALRDYKIEPTDWPEITFSLFGFPITVPAMTCQLGLEKTPMEFIAHIVHVFRGVKRVLRDDGTCWINMGDNYATNAGGYQGKNSYIKEGTIKSNTICSGMKRKDMVGIPWMMAFALRDDGWFLRQEIIWHKKNPMPESVSDRCTKSHETIFLLSKKKKYFFDPYAISTEITDASVKRYMQNVENQKGSAKSHGGKRHNGNLKAEGAKFQAPHPHAWGNNENFDSRDPRDKRNRKEPEDDYAINGKGMQGHSGYFNADGELMSNGRANKKSVWTMGKAQSTENHFASYPEELPSTCIKAGSSEHGVCVGCGNPWVRITDKNLVPGAKAAKTFVVDDRDHAADEKSAGNNKQKDGHKPGHHYEHSNERWVPTCTCNKARKNAIILDPFGGTNTTGVVSRKLNRDFISFDASPEYIKIGDTRQAQELGMFR